MSRRWKDPLRPLTADERIALTRLSRSPSAPAAQVERARALLAIADGASSTAAAHQVGRRHTETISAWVSRFNREGLAAVRPGHGGGARVRYGADAQQRILAEWARAPQREQDGTATWSLSLLWNSKRRQRRRRSCGALIHRLGGSGACTQRPLRRNRPKGASECQIPRQTTH
jgi:transposase